MAAAGVGWRREWDGAAGGSGVLRAAKPAVTAGSPFLAAPAQLSSSRSSRSSSPQRRSGIRSPNAS